MGIREEGRILPRAPLPLRRRLLQSVAGYRRRGLTRHGVAGGDASRGPLLKRDGGVSFPEAPEPDQSACLRRKAGMS